MIEMCNYKLVCICGRIRTFDMATGKPRSVRNPRSPANVVLADKEVPRLIPSVDLSAVILVAEVGY